MTQAWRVLSEKRAQEVTKAQVVVATCVAKKKTIEEGVELDEMDDFTLDHYAFVADIKPREGKTEKDKLHKYRCTISHQSCHKLLPNDSLLPF